MYKRNQFEYGTEPLTVEGCMEIAQGHRAGVLTQSVKATVTACRNNLEAMAEADRPIYGVNTGFGALCDVRISSVETHQLQKNLLITHAVGVGESIAPLLSKIMMICKVHALCKGFSGIRLEVIERILYFIENDMLPVVPKQGSVGASGDLAPLSHLFLPLIGEGYFNIEGETKPAGEVLQKHGLAPIQLKAKEGLALINGTQFILAHAVMGLHKMKYLLDLADLAGAMTIEGYQGSVSPFMAALHKIRPFPGNIEVANHMRTLLEGSENNASHASCNRVQDPYSLRCIPQVHGASRTAHNHLRELVTIELNSVTDNPIILSDTEAISGGNFHGQPLAIALDYATVAAAELGNISDRRCYLLLEGKFGLPRLLTDRGGLNSGFMIPQYTTAALASENKSLCFPASADSIPTSLGQEDHVSMGSISGRKFVRILQNIEHILAIELMYAAQALEFRRPLRCSDIVEEAHTLVRTRVPKLKEDRLIMHDMEAILSFVKNRQFRVR